MNGGDLSGMEGLIVSDIILRIRGRFSFVISLLAVHAFTCKGIRLLGLNSCWGGLFFCFWVIGTKF